MSVLNQAASGATHVFCTMAPAAQAALKADVARAHPGWKPAFSRPGLCTFKLDAARSPALPAPSFLSRCWGLGLGQVANGDVLWAALVKAGLSEVPLCLQVSPRVLPALAEPNAPVAAEDVAGVRAALLREAPQLALRVVPDEEAHDGECVVDVLCARGEPHFAGWHVHEAGRRVPYPGGALPVVVPPQLVSRAYVKVLEALAWGGVVVQRGDRAVELGSAPGGAAMALLELGVAVTGVDPGAMDPRVEAYVGPGGARLTHLKRLMSAVGPADLGRPLHWLMLDANVAPQVALSTVARLLGPRQDALCGVVLTLKLDGFAAAHHVPGWVKRVEELGMSWVGATHLPSNHTEVCVVGLTRAGLARRPPVGK